jgi:hypothetical protein
MRRAHIGWILVIALAAAVARARPPAAAQPLAPTAWVEVYRLRLGNAAGGAVEASEDGGQSWRLLGRVLRPAVASAVGFNASRWGTPGTVVASGANAVHLKVGDTPQGRGRIVTLWPAGSGWAPHVILTDIPGGRALFGGRYSAFVGNPVLVERAGAVVSADGWTPAVGDRVTVVVQRPEPYPREIEFENRFGGLVRGRYADGSEALLGVVLRPVAGVGRFEGTQYVGIGRVRANHPGVIDVSTSPVGQVGGFQIIPRDHAHSPELVGAILGTQWMVVGPLNPLDPSPQGTAPLFSAFIAPRYEPEDLSDEEWQRRVSERFLVMVRLDGGPWGLFPPLVGKDNAALLRATHIKILMPLWHR